MRAAVKIIYSPKEQTRQEICSFVAGLQRFLRKRKRLFFGDFGRLRMEIYTGITQIEKGFNTMKL